MFRLVFWWLKCVPVLSSFTYLLVLYLRFFRVFFYSNFRLLCLCSLWIMSLHLYSVFVSVCLCLFVCLLCQCLFVVNIPLCFIRKSSRPFLINSFRSTQRWVVRGSFCTPSTTPGSQRGIFCPAWSHISTLNFDPWSQNCCKSWSLTPWKFFDPWIQSGLD